MKKRSSYFSFLAYLLSYLLPFVLLIDTDNDITTVTTLSGFGYLLLFWGIGLPYLMVLLFFLFCPSKKAAYLLLGCFLLTFLAAFSPGLLDVPPKYFLAHLTNVSRHLLYGYWISPLSFLFFWWSWYKRAQTKA